MSNNSIAFDTRIQVDGWIQFALLIVFILFLNGVIFPAGFRQACAERYDVLVVSARLAASRRQTAVEPAKETTRRRFMNYKKLLIV